MECHWGNYSSGQAACPENELTGTIGGSLSHDVMPGTFLFIKNLL